VVTRKADELDGGKFEIATLLEDEKQKDIRDVELLL
jgi:hypothetical protein